MNLAARALTVVVCLHAMGGFARAGPANPFLEAERTFIYHDYKKAIQLLEVLLRPASPGQALKDPQLSKAREYLAASYWFERQTNAGYLLRCQMLFQLLIVDNPKHTLEPYYYPPDSIKVYDQVRDDLIRMGKIQPDGTGTPPKPDPPDKPPPETVLYKQKVLVQEKSAVCLIPFGVGQFYNDDVPAGASFLVFEVLLLGTNITSYFLIESLKESSGYIRPENIDTAERLRIVLYSSLGVYLALTVGGIAHALVTFEPRTVVPLETKRIESVPGETDGNTGGATPAPAMPPTAPGGTASPGSSLLVTPGYWDDTWYLNFHMRF